MADADAGAGDRRERIDAIQSQKLFVIGSCAVAFGCGPREVVQVVDLSGAPVAGAEVEAVSPSMNSGPNVTDAKGEAILPGNVQGTQWILVSKKGYKRVHVDLPAKWPIRIQLSIDVNDKPVDLKALIGHQVHFEGPLRGPGKAAATYIVVPANQTVYLRGPLDSSGIDVEFGDAVAVDGVLEYVSYPRAAPTTQASHIATTAPAADHFFIRNPKIRVIAPKRPQP